MSYNSPGVYVEEKSSGIKPIAGVGTSVAGFVGVVEADVTMPTDCTLTAVDTPKRITNWETFKKYFGDFTKDKDNTLALAVYGFFENGGGACWVSRVNAAVVATPTATEIETTLDTLKPIDEISIVAVPGQTDSAIIAKILSHCSSMADRFAIIDGQNTTDFSTVANICDAAKDSDGYGAVYYPWLSVSNPLYDAADVGSEEQIVIPPAGHIAGIFSRSDTERGVHKAPANEVVRGALGLSQLLSKLDQDALAADVNVIRLFSGTPKVWGARNWTDDAEWKYVNIRRTMNFLKESIEEGLAWAVFEPNDSSLWQKIKRNATAFLTNVWRDGALFGASPEEAFYVKCDEEINPSEVRDLGQVITEIGVSLVKPAEFVVFRISQWQGTEQ